MTGAELKKKRLKLGLTQKQLAEKLDFTETYVGMLERGRHVQTTTQHAIWCLMYEAQVAAIGDRKCK